MTELPARSGLFIPPFHANEENPALCFRRDIELLEWADRLGFDEAWIGEHHSGGFETIASPELIIAAAAERTSRIRFGTGVVSLPYHNPFMVAQRIVQLDQMTLGRIMFGVGPGLLVYDAKMLGIDPNKTRERMVESLDVILRLFRGEAVTRKTDWFELADASLHILPYQQPYPEVVVASSHSPSGARIAGQHGLGMLCVAASAVGAIDVLSSNWNIAQELAAENGHSISSSQLRLVAPIHLAETREQARANVRFGLEKYLDYSLSTNPGGRASSAGLDPFDVISNLRGGVIGTPDDAIELVERLAAKQGGFGCLLMMAHDWADWEQTKKSYELYARFVVPHLRKMNDRRRASLDLYKAHEADVGRTQAAATQQAIDKHNADRAAQAGLSG